MFDLKRFRKERKLSQTVLADALGVGQSFISQIESGKDPMPDAFIKKLADIYNVKNISDYIVDEPILRGPTYYGGEDFEAPTYIPLLPISAQGGSLNDFIVSVKESDCERVISPINGAEFAMTVTGDSMAPEYPSGSQILIKKINERAFIDWGKAYVLDTCNGSVIKRIFPAEDKDPGKVKCVSINPDYPPFEVSFEDIFGVYRVLLSMSIK